jgi:hypothetical protein
MLTWPPNPLLADAPLMNLVRDKVTRAFPMLLEPVEPVRSFEAFLESVAPPMPADPLRSPGVCGRRPAILGALRTAIEARASPGPPCARGVLVSRLSGVLSIAGADLLGEFRTVGYLKMAPSRVES